MTVVPGLKTFASTEMQSRSSINDCAGAPTNVARWPWLAAAMNAHKRSGRLLKYLIEEHLICFSTTYDNFLRWTIMKQAV